MKYVINLLLFLLFMCLLWYILDSCAVQAHIEQQYQEAFSFIPFAVGFGASLIGNGLSNWFSSGNAEHLQSLSFEDNLHLQHDAQAFNQYEANKNRVYNTTERQAAQQFTEDMWNKNNAYNTPSAQIDRLRAAGLNPLSATMQSSNAQMVGASPQASGSAASSPANSVGIPTTQSFGFASDFANMYGSVANVDNIEQQTALLRKDNETRGIANYLALLEAKARVENTNKSTEEKQAEIDQINAMLHKIAAETNAVTVNSHTNIYNAETMRMEVEYNFKLGKERNAIEAFKASVQNMLADSQVKLNASEVKQINKMTDKIAAEVGEVRQKARAEHWTANRLRDEYRIMCKKYRGILEKNSSIPMKLSSSFMYMIDNFFNGVSASLPTH